MDCVFCKIIEGKLPSAKIFENENVLAIKDLSPQSPIHYLFMPKAHIENLNDLDQDSQVMSQLFSAIKEVAESEGFAKKGYRVAINTNKEGCQSVYHLHLHCLGGKQLGGNMTGIKG